MAEPPSVKHVKARRYLIAVAVFAAGTLAGFTGAHFYRAGTPDVADGAPLVTPTPLTMVDAARSPVKITNEDVAAVSSKGPREDTEPAPDTALMARLDEARSERERLGAELGQLRAALAALESRVRATRLAQAQDANETDADTGDAEEDGRRRRIDAETLLGAGFNDEDATFITHRWGDQQMALLRLRNRASREGWLGDPRYEEALREITRGPGSLRAALGEDEYDRFLFGTGRTNRVRVENVIEGSPAQAAGIGASDVLLRYDDAPVFTFEDLRAAIDANESEVEAILEVERDGRLLEFALPRGPIGVQVQGVYVEP